MGGGRITDFIAKAVEGVEGVFIVRWTWHHAGSSSFIQGLEFGLEAVEAVEGVLG